MILIGVISSFTATAHIPGDHDRPLCGAEVSDLIGRPMVYNKGAFRECRACARIIARRAREQAAEAVPA